MLITGLILAGLAAGFIVIGLRGRRVDSHPVCGKCRFDLDGVYPAITTCPECGFTLESETEPPQGSGGRATVRIGNRQRRRWALVVGSLGLVLSIGLLSAAMLGVNLDRYKPYGVLRAELQYLVGRDDSARTDAILTEVMRRVTAGSLDEANLEKLVTHALQGQADTSIPWSTLWGDVIDAYDEAVGLDEDRLVSYLRIGVAETVAFRPSIRSGDGLPVQFRRGEVRLGSGRQVLVMRRVAGGMIAGRPLPVSPGPIGSVIRGSSGGSGSAGSAIRLGEPPVIPGEYELTFQIEYSITEDSGSQGKTLATWTEPLSTTIKVLPADDTDITLIEPSASGEPDGELRGTITADRMVVHLYGSGILFLSGTIHLEGVYMPCAFDVVLIDADGNESGETGTRNGVVVGSVSYMPPDDDLGYANHGYGLTMEVPAGFDAKTVHVVLRPSREVARKSLNVTEIWGGEIVIENVPVQWPVGLPKGDK